MIAFLAQPLARPTSMILAFGFYGSSGIPANAVLVNGVPLMVNGLILLCTSSS
jgi:hypothetical protein